MRLTCAVGDGGGHLDLYEGGQLMTTATDDVRCRALTPFERGELGLRADNTSFEVRGFTVDRLCEIATGRLT